MSQFRPVVDHYVDDSVFITLVLNKHEEGGPYTYNLSIYARTCMVPVDLPKVVSVPMWIIRGTPTEFTVALIHRLREEELMEYLFVIQSLVRKLRAKWRRSNQYVA